MRLPLEILFRHRGMPLRPIGGRELRETLPELLVDFLPGGLERLFRDRQRNGLVRARDEQGVEFGMKSFSNPEQRQEPIVHRGKMAPKIDEAVFSWSNF